MAHAAKRSSRFISPEDLVFLIRKDKQKVNRLRIYLSWKDVRKNAKDNKDQGAENLVDEFGEEGERMGIKKI